MNYTHLKSGGTVHETNQLFNTGEAILPQKEHSRKRRGDVPASHSDACHSCLPSPLTHMSHQGPLGSNQTLVWQHLPALNFPNHKLGRGNSARRVLKVFIMNQMIKLHFHLCRSQDSGQTAQDKATTTLACQSEPAFQTSSHITDLILSWVSRTTGNKVPGKTAEINAQQLWLHPEVLLWLTELRRPESALLTRPSLCAFG